MGDSIEQDTNWSMPKGVNVMKQVADQIGGSNVWFIFRLTDHSILR